jgi:hypothetical protein
MGVILIGMPKRTQPARDRTTLMLSRDDYALLEKIRKENGWSVGEATRRAIHALFALDQHLAARAQQQKGEVRRMLERIRRDVNSGFLVRAAPMTKVDFDEGSVGIRVDDLIFAEQDDRLFARREVAGRVEVYEVKDGRLVLCPITPTPEEAALN